MKNIATSENKPVLLASLGSALEYYDFVIYGMLAKYLQPVFFPAADPNTATLQFFSVFALGYLVRPLGGIIAGTIGDRLGRRPAFCLFTLLMAISTLVIGMLPSHAQIGVSATLLLIFCRLCQGFSFGGELPGAATIVGEFSVPQRKAFRISFVVASASAGALLASLMLFLLTHFLNDKEITAWGWRLPFLLSGFLALIVFWIRRELPETPGFQSEKTPQAENPLKQLVLQQGSSILAGILLTFFVSSMVIGNLYFPYYINKYYHFPEKSIYLATTLSLIFSALILPLTGRLADRFPRNTLAKLILLGYLSLSLFLFKLLSYQDTYLLILFMFIHQFFIAAFSACYYPLMINLFPTKVRYTGIAACYNLSYAIMGLFPTTLTSLLQKFQTPLVMPLALSFIAVASYAAVVWMERSIKLEQRNPLSYMNA